MRTDSVTLSETAIDLARSTVREIYGPEFLPDTPRLYKGKVKNAQEAHEAIRPAGDSIVSVAEVERTLGKDEARLYDLIVKRTLASQMKNAAGRRMTLRVRSNDGQDEAVFQATGQVIDFPGFLRAYVEDTDDPEAELADKETILPPVSQGDTVDAKSLEAQEHHTTPPARLTEATLVKVLEEEGIGRPSTYASIIDTIQRRDYTFKKGNALVPTFTAFAVVSLMEQHMSHLIDSRFTAGMEERLDAISRGEGEILPYLREFYDLGIVGVDAPGLRPLLEKKIEDIDARTVCSVPIGKNSAGEDVIVRVGRYGPFIQRGETTAPVPDQTCPDEVTVLLADQLIAAKEKADEPMGTDPDSNKPVFIKTGRYGPYVQLGTADDDEKPKMVSLLKGMTPDTIDFETALKLISLPRVVGQDADGADIIANHGRYGPYIKRGTDTRSLAADDNLLEVSLERCLELLAEEKRGRGQRAPAKPIKVFENVEELDGKEIKVLPGRYGPYVTDGDFNGSLPRDMEDPESLTLSHALELLEAARLRTGKKKTKKKATKKKAAKKKAAKKTASKKAAKKTPGKKTAAKKTAAKKVASTKADKDSGADD